jgi:hypothetical protein
MGLFPANCFLANCFLAILFGAIAVVDVITHAPQV